MPIRQQEKIAPLTVVAHPKQSLVSPPCELYTLNKATLVVVGAAQKLVGSENLAAAAVVAHRVAHSVGVYDE